MLTSTNNFYENIPGLNAYSFLALLLFTGLTFCFGTNDYLNYDVKHYSLDVEPILETKEIKGSVVFHFSDSTSSDYISFHLDQRLQIDSIIHHSDKALFSRKGRIVTLKKSNVTTALDHFTVYYQGKPQEANNPPWDGGVVWSKDSLNRDWVAVACQGIGASIWWPTKEDLKDEPDSILISITTPKNLVAVSNGQLRSKKVQKEKIRWTWRVNSKINNYNVTFNIGHYKVASNEYEMINGDLLPIQFYILDHFHDSCFDHLEQSIQILKVYEELYGPYPFHTDGYKLAHTPYWGMEHQSCIAYGHNFTNNPYGFDFIILHETAHEYWGNSVSMKDRADMWIHESLATYSEALYIEKRWGINLSLSYLNWQKTLIKNEDSLLGPRGIMYDGYDTDIYYKGTWMWHTLRHQINNDSIWFAFLYRLHQELKLSEVNSTEFIRTCERILERDLQDFFSFYLRDKRLPRISYSSQNGTVHFTELPLANMLLPIYNNQDIQWVKSNNIRDASLLSKEIIHQYILCELIED